MKKKAITILASAALLATMTTMAFAGDQLKTQDRLRDGSCQLAADQLRDQDRLRDGSCQLAADQLRDQDRLRDGSCKA